MTDSQALPTLLSRNPHLNNIPGDSWAPCSLGSTGPVDPNLWNSRLAAGELPYETHPARQPRAPARGLEGPSEKQSATCRLHPDLDSGLIFEGTVLRLQGLNGRSFPQQWLQGPPKARCSVI